MYYVKLNISTSEFPIKDVRFLKYLKSILHISFILPSNDWVNQKYFFSILKKGVFFGELCICIPYLSRRPGRRRAGSSVSGRLVAMIIFTYKYMCSFNKNIMAMLSILQVCEDERECGVRGCINSSHIKKWFEIKEEIKEESSSVVCSSHSQRSEAKSSIQCLGKTCIEIMCPFCLPSVFPSQKELSLARNIEQLLKSIFIYCVDYCRLSQSGVLILSWLTRICEALTSTWSQHKLLLFCLTGVRVGNWRFSWLISDGRRLYFRSQSQTMDTTQKNLFLIFSTVSSRVIPNFIVPVKCLKRKTRNNFIIYQVSCWQYF